MNLNLLRLQLLHARTTRATVIARRAAALPDEHALVFLSLNVPGPEKESPRLDAVFERAREALATADARPGRAAATARPRRAAADARPRRAAATGVVDGGRDALGPWLAVAWPGKPDDIKRQCIAIEEHLPAGRLVDLDVYDPLGRQVDRGSLGQSPRRCLVCREAAVDCMRADRHRADEIAAAVDRLLHVNDVARLADVLVDAARIELDLTPKPGLVDRRDNGSHPDLSFDLMERSIALLPEYYDELLSLAGLKPCSTVSLPNPAEAGFHDDRLAACIGAGRRAEERMLAAIGTNAHRGYIFLSGLVLLGFCTFRDAASASHRSRRQDGRRPHSSATADLSSAVADVARRVAALRTASATGVTQSSSLARPTGVAQGFSLARQSHGETARLRHGVGGIFGEALAGLPSVFEHALPALERAEARYGATDAARHATMATLMTVVEDTTTLHRCGAKALQRLRDDGRRILEAIECGDGYVPLLERLNEDYRAAGMTMGGVADCLAITIAIRIFDGGRGDRDAGRR